MSFVGNNVLKTCCRGAKRALRLCRDAETKFELEILQAHARFGIRKLLASGEVNGNYAKALRLYAGLDTGRWRTYEQVGKLMHVSKERVRQLLKRSKIILANTLVDNTAWKPVQRGATDIFPRRQYNQKCRS